MTTAADRPVTPEPIDRLSIIYTTRDDPWWFHALDGLRSVETGGLRVEVIAVLHGSRADYTCRTLAAAATLHLDVVVGYLAAGTTISAARNCGARLASHDTLLFLDSDCVVLPGSLAALAGRRVRLANGPVDFVSSGSWFSRHNCKVRDLGYRSLRTRLPHMPNLLINRDLFEGSGGFRVELGRGEDFEFGDRLVRAGEYPQFLPVLRVAHIDDRRPTKTVRNWYRNGWGAAVRRRMWRDSGQRARMSALVTPSEPLAHGVGYAVVSSLGALVLTGGYIAGTLATAGRAGPEWTVPALAAELSWVSRFAAGARRATP